MILIRHGEVEPNYKSVCYGQLDVPLSDEGYASSLTLAQKLACGVKPSVIFHSGLSRTKFLAIAIARSGGGIAPVVEDRRLQERNFGQWQGKSWDRVFQLDPEIHNLIYQPDTYRPLGGETTTEMQRRIVGWFESVREQFAAHDRKTILAVSHSGPIAALSGDRLQLPASRWQPWMLRPLEGLRITPSVEPDFDDLTKEYEDPPRLRLVAR